LKAEKRYTSATQNTTNFNTTKQLSDEQIPYHLQKGKHTKTNQMNIRNVICFYDNSVNLIKIYFVCSLLIKITTQKTHYLPAALVCCQAVAIRHDG
jgi:hypothetical protein